MHLLAAFALFLDLGSALLVAFIPTLLWVLTSPSRVFRPRSISQFFMAKTWETFGDAIDERDRADKDKLIAPNAHGVVLDLGAGNGHAIPYLDTKRVTKYVAVEPNALMHPKLRQTADKAGFTEANGTLIILGCGGEDINTILQALGGAHSIDTIVSIMALCSVPEPQKTARVLAQEALKPGGLFLFYEHVLSPRKDVQWWQSLWTPLWVRAFDGCCLDRPTHIWIEEIGGWSDKVVWGNADETEENLFWHRFGKFVKAA